MQEDAYLTWHPYQEVQTTLYSHAGAIKKALDITVPMAAIFLLLGYAGAWRTKLTVCLGLVTLAVGLTIYVRLPKTQVILTRTRQIATVLNSRNHWGIANWIGEPRQPSQLTAAWVRSQLASTSSFWTNMPPDYRMNYFTRQPLREEDSPGNYSIREGPEGVEYLWYDMDGGEHQIPIGGRVIVSPGRNDRP